MDGVEGGGGWWMGVEGNSKKTFEVRWLVRGGWGSLKHLYQNNWKERVGKNDSCFQWGKGIWRMSPLLSPLPS